MAFDLNFNIRSLFDQAGFDEAEKAMSQLDKASGDLGLSTSELNDRIDALDISYNEATDRFQDAQGNIMGTQDAMEELGSEQSAIAAAANEMGESQEFVQEQLSRTNMVMHENTEGAKQFRDMSTGAFVESKEASEDMQDQLQTFRFDMLSLMFAGMALSRTMQDLTNPAMESAGVFEVISDTLEVFFLPAAMMAMDLIMGIRSILANVPAPVRKAIGAISILAIIVGKLASVFGIIILNWSTIMGILSSGMTVLSAVAGAFTSFGSIIFGAMSSVASVIVSAVGTIVGAISLPIVAIAAVIAAIVGFALAWKDNLFGIRQKVGKFVQFVGKHFKTIAKIMFLPLEPLNMIIKAINRLTGKSLPTVDDVLGDVGDSIEEMGKGFEESGNKMDEMKKKAPDKKKQGFLSKFMPDIGPDKKSASMKKPSMKQEGMNVGQINNRIQIDGTEYKDEKEIAEKIGEVQETRSRGITRSR